MAVKMSAQLFVVRCGCAGMCAMGVVIDETEKAIGLDGDERNAGSCRRHGARGRGGREKDKRTRKDKNE